MAGLLCGREYAAGRRAPAVWPCARVCALAEDVRERFHHYRVGRPTAYWKPVGWGTLPPPSPRGGGPVREANSASRPGSWARSQSPRMAE